MTQSAPHHAQMSVTLSSEEVNVRWRKRDTEESVQKDRYISVYIEGVIFLGDSMQPHHAQMQVEDQRDRHICVY